MYYTYYIASGGDYSLSYPSGVTRDNLIYICIESQNTFTYTGSSKQIKPQLIGFHADGFSHAYWQTVTNNTYDSLVTVHLSNTFINNNGVMLMNEFAVNNQAYRCYFYVIE